MTTAGFCRSAIRTRKINLPASQEGFDSSETIVRKLLARRIQICQIHFSVIIFDFLFLKQVKIWPQQKWARKIWIHLVKYSSSEVSDPSKMPRISGNLIF